MPFAKSLRNTLGTVFVFFVLALLSLMYIDLLMPIRASYGGQ